MLAIRPSVTLGRRHLPGPEVSLQRRTPPPTQSTSPCDPRSVRFSVRAKYASHTHLITARHTYASSALVYLPQLPPLRQFSAKPKTARPSTHQTTCRTRLWSVRETGRKPAPQSLGTSPLRRPQSPYPPNMLSLAPIDTLMFSQKVARLHKGCQNCHLAILRYK